MKFWDRHKNWDEAEKAWDEGAKEAAQAQSLKKVKRPPMIPAIAEKHLKWKSFNYLVFNRRAVKILKQCLKHPIRYGWGFLKSIVKQESPHSEGDFFFYGIKSTKEFVKEAKKERALVIVGFSFCQKPLECPASRFSDKCIADVDHPVCRQCDIGKVVHALPEKRAIPLLIPTVHYIGEKIFEIMEKHKERELLFLITACEMSLKMFGDFGNMVALKGIGVRLGGRICNTMRAFELAEEGAKPGLTLVLPKTQAEILVLMREIRNSMSN